MAATIMYLVDLQLQRAKMTNGLSCWALKSAAMFVLRTSFPLASPRLSMAERARQARSCGTQNSTDDQLWFKNSPTQKSCPTSLRPQDSLGRFLSSLFLGSHMYPGIRHVSWSDGFPYFPMLFPHFLIQAFPLIKSLHT